MEWHWTYFLPEIGREWQRLGNEQMYRWQKLAVLSQQCKELSVEIHKKELEIHQTVLRDWTPQDIAEAKKRATEHNNPTP